MHVSAVFAADRDPPTANLGDWRATIFRHTPTPVIPGVDDGGELYPLDPDVLKVLDAFMFAADSPYTRTQVGAEAYEIEAKGRSALALATFIEKLAGKR